MTEGASRLKVTYHKIPAHLKRGYIADCEFFSSIYLDLCLEGNGVIWERSLGTVGLARVVHQAECREKCLTTTI